MESNTGLSNRQKALALYKWSIRKNLPISIAYWILLFLTFPMAEIFMMIVTTSNGDGLKDYTRMMKEGILYVPSTAFACVAILFSIIAAIIAFSYMHNKRCVDLFGSFPVSRRTLFFTRYFATLTVCIVPVIVFGVIGALLAFSNTAIIATAKIIGILILSIIGNVSFIAFISVCCGTAADVIVSYVVINVIYPICVVILGLFPASVIPGLSGLSMKATIFTCLVPSASFFTNNFSYGSSQTFGIVWWVSLSVVLMAACFALCKKRKAETAQNAFAFNAVEIVIKFFTCFAVGFGIGYMLSFLGEDSIKAQHTWFIVGVIIAIMTANILLHLVFHRGLSKYSGSLIECGVVFACTLAFLFIVTTGGLGYMNQIPQKNDIQEVSIRAGEYKSFRVGGVDLLENFTTDKEIIDTAYEIHQGIVKNYEKKGGFLPIVRTNDYYESEYGTTKITYKLKNGKTLTREYSSSTDVSNVKTQIDKIRESKYYTTLNIIYKVPDKYAESLQISMYTGTEYDEEYYEGSSYYEEPAYVEYDILFFDQRNAKDSAKIEKVLKTLRGDMTKFGTYTPKEGEEVFGIYVRYSAGEYADDDWVYSTVYIPKTYKDTIAVLKEVGCTNLGGYYLASQSGQYDVDVAEDKYESDQVIYFSIPDTWDADGKLQCMPLDSGNMFWDIYGEIETNKTSCTKISERVWAYKLPDVKAASKNWGGENFSINGIMFYEKGKEETKMTGAIPLPEDYNGKILKLGKQTETDFHEYMAPMYEYQWEKFEDK